VVIFPFSTPDADIPVDRLSLQPSAFELHTQLAHSLVRYLGLSSPSELAEFGLNSPGDLVDIISRVRAARNYILS
jgi:hypothetical protein